MDTAWALFAAVVACLLYSLSHWVISQRRKCFDAFEGTGIPTVPLRSLVNGNSVEFRKPNCIESLDRWLNEYGDVFGFSPENLDLINQTAYQPFGIGPRICVGQRLALLELASVTTQVLRHFRITLGPSQKRDLELDTYSFLAVPKEEVRIKLHRLNSDE
ncbi:hypothetical protein V5799_022140 [Amblyomma americanum]|uniref:Cytochrome n=1 Tax=Amblyomma americanum TaxID=6943 RepID=A0AAQ4FMV1_AMBAM